jgi:predicted PolB exonuclease-like 3'-5' exonuclease
VPVLALRALRHGLSQRFYGPAHRRRYDEENHLDLMAALTEYGMLGRTGFSLSMMSSLIGLPGKAPDEDGSKVAGMYEKGEHAKIQLYAQSDVVRTTFLLYRYLLLRGRIELDMYRRAAFVLLELCKERKLTNVLFGCDAKRLLLEG